MPIEMKPTVAVDPAIERELKRMSVESGISYPDLVSELKELSTELASPVGALSALKSRHRRWLGGITGTFIARVVGKGSIPTDDPSIRRGLLSLWIQTKEGVYESAPRTLWDDNETKYSNSTEVNQVVQFEGKLLANGITCRVLKGGLNPVDTEFPTVPQLVQKVGSVPLNEISNYVGQQKFVKGAIGRIFDTPFGSGFEMSDIGANPTTVFVNEPLAITVGQEVITYSYISQSKTGDIVLNAKGIF